MFKDPPETTDLMEEGRRMGTLRDKATLSISLISPIVPLAHGGGGELSHIMHSNFIGEVKSLSHVRLLVTMDCSL